MMIWVGVRKDLIWAALRNTLIPIHKVFHLSVAISLKSPPGTPNGDSAESGTVTRAW